MKTLRRNLELARAQPGEASDLSRLAFAAKASHGYGADQMAAWRTDLTVTEVFLEAHVTWVARLDGDLAGWGVTVAWGRRCRLEHLWIAPAYQRQGIGRILLRHLAVEARAAGWTELEILSDPLAASFYQRCGAQSAGDVALSDGRRLPLLLLSV